MEVPKCSINPKFPILIQQWCAVITKYADQFGVDPNLIAAMMLQESGGNAQAYSKSGAVGLLQVMPRDGLAATFTCINGPCFANRPSMAELYHPGFNVMYGTQMIAGLIAKYGNERDALLRYGPMDMGYYYADKVLALRSNYQ